MMSASLRLQRPLARTLSTSSRLQYNLEKSTDQNSGDGPADKIHMGRIVLRNFRNLRKHRHALRRDPKAFPNYPRYDYGQRRPGLEQEKGFELVPEMIPELVVPDLKDCKLRPYVSYRSKEIHQEELTAKDLFNAVYGKKVLADYKEGKLDDQGEPLEPSEEERMTAEEARVKARKTGSDIFLGGAPRSKMWKVRWSY